MTKDNKFIGIGDGKSLTSCFMPSNGAPHRQDSIRNHLQEIFFHHYRCGPKFLRIGQRYFFTRGRHGDVMARVQYESTAAPMKTEDSTPAVAQCVESAGERRH